MWPMSASLEARLPCNVLDQVGMVEVICVTPEIMSQKAVQP